MCTTRHWKANQRLAPLFRPGWVAWLYVLDGAVTVGESRLEKGDGISASHASLPLLQAEAFSALVLFLVDVAAPHSMVGTISGTCPP